MKPKTQSRELPGDPENWPRVVMPFRYSESIEIQMKAEAYFGKGRGGEFFKSIEELNRAKEKLSIRIAKQGGAIHYDPSNFCIGAGGVLDLDRLHAVAIVLYHRKHPMAIQTICQLTELLITTRSAEKAAQGLELLAKEIRDKSKIIKRKRAALPVYQAALDHILEFRTIPTNDILGGRCKDLGVTRKTYYAALTDIEKDLGRRITREYNT